MMGQHIQAVHMWWIRLAVLTTKQIVETIMTEHYMAILPFKPPNWVL